MQITPDRKCTKKTKLQTHFKFPFQAHSYNIIKLCNFHIKHIMCNSNSRTSTSSRNSLSCPLFSFILLHSLFFSLVPFRCCNSYCARSCSMFIFEMYTKNHAFLHEYLSSSCFLLFHFGFAFFFSSLSPFLMGSGY